ncbi:hypothetical protein CHS0354_021775 [Potamilus streckersoni]|uniref:Uncharacterized protein n=1 Tax=Potamilus streckersoni TaxID=2493646 RepID=A0AAE0S3T9_9BIVA|nr:hypothetical protein CHS0354_021775 [Potamilus streckersoni]
MKYCSCNCPDFIVTKKLFLIDSIFIIITSHNDRVFIDNKAARKMLLNYVKGNLVDFDAMMSFLVKHQPSLLPLMEYFRQIGSTDKCPDEYSKLVKLLASPSPVCGTFHYTFIDLLKKYWNKKT